jgi:ubiquinone/menaquinone biosynthesis C-methylase UbiE
MLEEAQHFDGASHGLAIQAHPYFHSKMMRDYKQELALHLRDHARKSIIMADIGCGGGTGIDMLSVIDFDRVEYFGADLSMKRLALASQKTLDPNWNARFMRADAGRKLFADSSMDIMFCNAALHHLPLEPTLEWFSNVLKDNGLLIINEPSSGNLVARIGRKMVSNLNTSEEHPLDANLVRTIAETKYGLRLISQRGMHCFVGPIAFLADKMHASQKVAKILYALSRLADKMLGESVRYNYSFMQIYEKTAYFQAGM